MSVHEAMSEARLATLRWMQTASLAIVIVTLSAEAALVFRPMLRRVARFTQAPPRIAATDPLTGALDRRC